MTRVIAASMLFLACVAHEARAQAAGSAAHRSSRGGVYSPGQAERGRMQYAISCRSCHTAASHTGVTFAKWWKDRTVGDLFGYMSTQMPKNDHGSLEPGQYADVVAYLLKMNAMPAGAADLLPDSAGLAQIRIELKSAPGKPAPARKRVTSPTRKKSP